MAAAYPLLLGIEAYPRQVFYGTDVYSITPASDSSSLNDTFASSVANQTWAVTVSPEVYAFTSWGGVPVIARGVNSSAFLELEGARLVNGSSGGSNFALLGSEFARRNGVSVGSAGVLVGSTAYAIEPVTVTGIFSSSGPSSDEVLVPLVTARKMAALDARELGALRLRTSDSPAMMDFLEGAHLALAIASNKGIVYVNSPGGSGNRLSSLVFLYPELGTTLSRSFVSGFAQEGANGVRVVVLAFIVLLTVLVVAGIYSIVWRATSEASKNIGILRVVGAGRAAVLLSLFREVLGPGFLAISGGLIAGEIVASLVGTYGVLIVFSHAIQPQFDLLLALEILAIAVATTALSCILCGNASLKRDPRDLIAQVEPKREELPEEAMQL